MSPLVPLFPPIVPPCIIVYTCISHSQHKRYLYDVVLNCHCGATVYGCAVCAAVLQLGVINLPGHQGAVRHGTRPRAPAGGKGWAKGSGAETCPGGHLLASRCSRFPACTLPHRKNENSGIFQNVGGGGAVDPGQGVHGWAAVQASVQRVQPGGIVSACGSIGAGPSRSRPPRQTGQPCKRPFRPALLLPMDPWRPVCQPRHLGAILGVGSGRSHSRRRTPYGGGIQGPTSPPAPRIQTRAAGQGGGGRTGAGGPAYQYAPKN